MPPCSLNAFALHWLSRSFRARPSEQLLRKRLQLLVGWLLGQAPSQRTTQLAKDILDDLRGASYYVDPKILGELLKGTQNTEADGERRAGEVLRYLFQKYAPRRPTEKDIEELAGILETSGSL